MSAPKKYDALVVGSGIGGMESALKLGDMGYKVLIVEKEPSVGGKMILLSKVFPTLDCASCISTPKMGATIHHPNIDVLTYAEVEGIRGNGNGGGYHAKIKQKAKFVDEAACTGCRQCEMACNVAVPDEYNADMVSRRAAFIAFPQAVPKKAVISREGVSPCTYECPAGIKAHGYVARVRSGEYDQAFDLVLETTPLVGSLGRACYAPCEEQCTRGELEGPLPIRQLKRFIADKRYGQAEPKAIEKPERNGKKVAVVGSGPAGLTASWQLARQGYGVKIFEAAPQAGGMLRLGIPAYRLPNDVIDDDVANVTAIGVEIATNARVDDVAALKDDGFDAVLVATGTHKAVSLRVPGEELEGIQSALTFLADVKLGKPVDLAGKNVLVVGGGNVAIDAARTARRLGATTVHQASLECCEDMPAHDFEVEEAKAEGITLHDGWGVNHFTGDGHVETAELKVCSCVFDPEGKFAPEYDESKKQTVACDVVIIAAGMGADTEAFGLEINGNRTLKADPGSLQTSVPHVFAAGDVVTGPTMITTAVGQGRRAAFMIDRYLTGATLDIGAFDEHLPVADKSNVLARQDVYDRREPLESHAAMSASPTDFNETEATLTEDEAFLGAARCLDCGICSECHACVDACPADAIKLDMQPEEIDVDVDAVVLATGFRLFPADAKPEYGYGKFKNVITGMQMDRLLAPTRPFNSVVRPGDGKVPDRIGLIMCTGSRDAQVGNPLCSRICCMYSVKHNQLIMGALPLADVTVHYMDVRAVGKGYDEFYQQAKDMGSMFIKGRVAKITEKDNGNLIVRYEDIEGDGGIVEAEYDMVVLAVGVQPNTEAAKLFENGALGLDEYFYVGEADEDLDPGRTNMPGVFVAGSASGVKDIPDSILHAGAAVAQAAAHIEKARVANGAETPEAAKVEVTA
ncbi:MAG TPA: FAD-dependent oxidoreductase [Thermoleophilia bacterium]|nr:FAD-dependent oxidoreductase [Thermoleophilia bacterium]